MSEILFKLQYVVHSACEKKKGSSCHILPHSKLFYKYRPSKYSTFLVFLKITFRIWQNDYLNPSYFHMDSNIFQFEQNPQDDGEEIAVGEQYLYLLLKKYFKMIVIIYIVLC